MRGPPDRNEVHLSDVTIASLEARLPQFFNGTAISFGAGGTLNACGGALLHAGSGGMALGSVNTGPGNLFLSTGCGGTIKLLL